MRRARSCICSSGASRRVVKGWRAERANGHSTATRKTRNAHPSTATMLYRWNFVPVFENLDVLWVGALGMGFGLVVGLGRHAKSRWVYVPATAFVEFFRNTPVLVQILWFYYALPILLPFQISPLTAAALGISLNS